jgi:hypothetical protein
MLPMCRAVSERLRRSGYSGSVANIVYYRPQLLERDWLNHVIINACGCGMLLRRGRSDSRYRHYIHGQH